MSKLYFVENIKDCLSEKFQLQSCRKFVHLCDIIYEVSGGYLFNLNLKKCVGQFLCVTSSSGKVVESHSPGTQILMGT